MKSFWKNWFPFRFSLLYPFKTLFWFPLNPFLINNKLPQTEILYTYIFPTWVGLNFWYFKFRTFYLTEVIVWNIKCPMTPGCKDKGIENFPAWTLFKWEYLCYTVFYLVEFTNMILPGWIYQHNPTLLSLPTWSYLVEVTKHVPTWLSLPT